MNNRNNEILKALRALRAIEPDPVFAKTSRALILGAEKTGRLSGLFPLPPLVQILYGGAVVAVLLVASYFLLIPSQPVVSAALNPENLTKELVNLSINIQLKELSYQQNANAAIASALSEIQNTSVKHLNQTLLEGEEETINVEGAMNPAIDKMLESVISK